MLVPLTAGEPNGAWSELRKGGEEVCGAYEDWAVI